MQELLNIFNELANESSRTGKEVILEKHKGNELFRFTLDFLYNPFVLTGISTKKLKKKIAEPFDVSIKGHDFDDIKDLMAYLKWSNTGRDYDICVVQNFIDKQESDELKDFVKKVVSKDLKVGISDKTINKVYGKGVIPSFAVMLAESYEKKESKLKGKFYITQKLDGNRCVAMRDKDGVKFFTRKGQPIEQMVQLEEELMKFPVGWLFDGELLLINKNNLSSDDLFRATQKVVRKDGEKKDLEFYIFDALPLSEFKEGKSKKNYEQRRNTLELMFGKHEDEVKFTKLLPTLYEGEDKSMVAVLMKYAEEKGWEGLMVNTASGLYQSKRTADLLKVKKMKTADLLVMNLEKAVDGQFKDLLARVNVEYKGNLVGVGSGFTLEERRMFTENPDLIVGKIIEVQYFEESKDEKTGAPSLRFPIFKGIRHDKTVEDINYE